VEPVAFFALFAIAALNAAIPGPCMILTFSRSAGGGLRSGARVSGGILLGELMLAGITFLMMLGLFTVTHEVFAAMKWAGAALLLVLAASLLQARRPACAGRPEGHGADVGDVVSGMLLALSSPFNLVFMLALVPQFIPSGGLDAATMLRIVTAFLSGQLVAQVGATLLGAGSLRLACVRVRWIEYACAAALIGFAGAALLAPLD
jgi:homoserine/homoserine lactone efflux protein